MFARYKLTTEDAQEINRRRIGWAREEPPSDWPTGAQAHFGNPAHEGEVYPAVVVLDIDGTLANLQVFLDGNDSFWATSRRNGTEPGEWIAG